MLQAYMILYIIYIYVRVLIIIHNSNEIFYDYHYYYYYTIISYYYHYCLLSINIHLNTIRISRCQLSLLSRLNLWVDQRYVRIRCDVIQFCQCPGRGFPVHETSYEFSISRVICTGDPRDSAIRPGLIIAYYIYLPICLRHGLMTIDWLIDVSAWLPMNRKLIKE